MQQVHNLEEYLCKHDDLNNAWFAIHEEWRKLVKNNNVVYEVFDGWNYEPLRTMILL